MRLYEFLKKIYCKLFKNDFKKVMNISFVSILGVIIFIGFMTMFLPPKKSIPMENRNSSSFKFPTIKTLARGTFQENFESAFADQFPMSRNIKKYSLKILNMVDYNNINPKICSNRYVYISSDRAIFDCSNHIVELPLNDVLDETLNNHITYLNLFNTLADTYYYVLERSSAYDLENNVLAFDTYDYLVNHLTGDYHISKLVAPTYSDYQKYFYQTDHHWNLYGSYQGYKDIMNMLHPDDDILKPVKIKTLKVPFVGSNAKTAKAIDMTEQFSFYDFVLPKHYTWCDGVIKEYTNLDYDNPTNQEFVNYYASVYGSDIGEVIFDYQQPDKENLMIFASSYSNPINILIASHFNRTFVFDLRHYEGEIDFAKYVEANDIDKILVIASTDILTNTNFDLKGDDGDAI